MRALVIDNFAGGGGASTGIERAIGRAIDVAINHDPEAIAMHAANHPATLHHCQSIMAVDPLEATGGAPVALAWFSPDCKHHSKAKGGKPREKNIRDLAWVVVHWIERLQDDFARAGRDPRTAIRCIMLENVEEFRRWGPLDDAGMPIKEREGEEFDLFVRRIRRRGARVEFRELRACDYGAPTSRKRLYMIARFDGLPIVWPAPTHGKRGSTDVVTGKLRLWRSAAECIDWSIPCPSIFDRKRPLKDATHRRIAHGVMRYVVNSAAPFIVGVGGRRGQSPNISIDRPFPTATAKGDAAIVDAAIVPITHGSDGAGRCHDPADPLRTITTANGGEMARVTATLTPHITKFYSTGVGSDADNPMPTVTANGHSARAGGATPLGLVVGTMAPLQNGERRIGEKPRQQDLREPASTIATGGKHSAVTAFLSHFYTSNTNGGQGDPDLPAKAVTAEGQHHAVVCAHMEQANTGRVGHAATDPVSTITTQGSHQRLVQTTLIEADALPPALMQRAVQVAAFLVKYYGSGETQVQAVDRPLDTVTTLARFAVVTVMIDAVTYVIVDIGMRMLTRRELANAQGFPADYELAPLCSVARREDGTWRQLPAPRPLPVASSIRMIGNSVCPDMSETLVRANLPDLCVATDIATGREAA